jgi:hypothetical protein
LTLPPPCPGWSDRLGDPLVEITPGLTTERAAELRSKITAAVGVVKAQIREELGTNVAAGRATKAQLSTHATTYRRAQVATDVGALAFTWTNVFPAPELEHAASSELC